MDSLHLRIVESRLYRWDNGGPKVTPLRQARCGTATGNTWSLSLSGRIESKPGVFYFYLGMC